MSLAWLPGRLGLLSGVRINSSDILYPSLWILLWDATNPQAGCLFSAPFVGQSGISFSRDGRRLALLFNYTIGLWKVQTSAELVGQQKTVQPDTLRTDPSGTGFMSVDWSPVNAYLAAGNHKGQILLWQEPAGQPIQTLESSAQVKEVSFSPRGDRLASLHGDGRVRIWDTSKYAAPGPALPAAAPVDEAADNEPRAEIKKAVADIDASIDKTLKSKNTNANAWQQAHAALNIVRQQAENVAELALVDAVRKRLSRLATARLDAAVRNRRSGNYFRYLQEAVALDPDSEAGKKAQQLMTGGRPVKPF
jgi:WD40 repeat protein